MSALVEAVVVSHFDLHPPQKKFFSIFILNLKYSDESLFTSCARDTFFLPDILVSLWTEVKLFREKKKKKFKPSSAASCVLGGILEIYKASDNTGGI